MHLVYIFLFATQLVAAFVFAGAAMGHTHAFIKAEGAIPLTPAGALIRTVGCLAAAILIAVGLTSDKWVADLGVMIVALLLILELRRLQGASTSTRRWGYITAIIVILFSAISVIKH